MSTLSTPIFITLAAPAPIRGAWRTTHVIRFLPPRHPRPPSPPASSLHQGYVQTYPTDLVNTDYHHLPQFPCFYPLVLLDPFPTPAGLSTASDILLPSVADLNKKVRLLKLDAIHDLVRAVSRAIVPTSMTVDELLGAGEGDGSDGAEEGDGDWLGTGDAGLDECLGGGLRVGCLTEFTGER